MIIPMEVHRQTQRWRGKTGGLIRFHGVLPLGEVDVLLVLPRRLQLFLVLKVARSSGYATDETGKGQQGRTVVNRLRIALVFFGRRSRGRYFFFL